jgi:formylmethanofuran dehydrogenase subunit A
MRSPVQTLIYFHITLANYVRRLLAVVNRALECGFTLFSATGSLGHWYLPGCYLITYYSFQYNEKIDLELHRH